MSLDKLIAAAQKNHGTLATKPTGATYAIEKIKLRESDTRELNLEHIQELAASIEVLGLIEPIALDKTGRLLAGAHRLAAVQWLQAENLAVFEAQFPGNAVPCRIFDFEATSDPDRALQIEIAENEKRRDYTPTEVKELAQRLRSAGFVDAKGRPKKGQKPLMPALSVVIGKSIRRVQQYLNDPDALPVKAKCESTKYFVLLEQAQRALIQAEKIAPPTPLAQKFSEALPEILMSIEEARSERI